jgi:hypothetical protein
LIRSAAEQRPICADAGERISAPVIPKAADWDAPREVTASFRGVRSPPQCELDSRSVRHRRRGGSRILPALCELNVYYSARTYLQYKALCV